MFFIVAFDAAYLKHVVIKMKLKAEVFSRSLLVGNPFEGIGA